MAISKKTRFDVFKRDAFTCTYCGRKPPAVTLEADHIFPKAEGGGDELENLTTSCFDCNRGKSDGVLDERAPTPDIASQTELLKEREEQLRALHAVKEEAAARRGADYEACRVYWFDVWGVDDLPRWHMPWENSLRLAVNVLGVAEVKEAMDITAGRFNYVTADATRYLGGILKRKIAAAEGRITKCIYCDKDMVLDRGDDLEGRWYHVACKEKQAADG